MPPEEARRPLDQEGTPQVLSNVGSTDAGSVAPQAPELNDKHLRPASYIAPRADTIPPELKAIDQWVAWRYELRRDRKTGELKVTKIPVDPLTGANAKSNNKATWGTFDQAWARYQGDGLDGVGFVLTREIGIVGIDVDHRRDAATGVIDDDALAVVRAIDSYTEISPSGTGIRIFARGKLPRGWRKRGRFEMYEHGRYLTVTGAHLELP